MKIQERMVSENGDERWCVVDVPGFQIWEAQQIIYKYRCAQCHGELAYAEIDRILRNFDVYCERCGSVTRVGRVTVRFLEEQRWLAEREYNEVVRNIGEIVFPELKLLPKPTAEQIMKELGY